jgi:hypothetical protein
MRGLVKGWSNAKPFTRRVRWYEAKSDDIRLQFDEVIDGERATYHAFYSDPAQAEADMEMFRSWAMEAPVGESIASSFGEKLDPGRRFAYRSRMPELEKRIVRGGRAA